MENVHNLGGSAENDHEDNSGADYDHSDDPCPGPAPVP